MDLNKLYFRHQLSVMRAAATQNLSHRADHLAAAETLAGRIACIQQRTGAVAAQGWAAIATPGHLGCECRA